MTHSGESELLQGPVVESYIMEKKVRIVVFQITMSLILEVSSIMQGAFVANSFSGDDNFRFSYFFVTRAQRR